MWTMPAGSELEPAGFVFLEEWRPGGAVLFRQHLVSLDQTRRLIGDMQDASRGSVVFVAADQEGGRVTRLPPPATSFPSAEALAATGDPSLAEAAAHACARELRAFGITVNL